MRASGRQRLDDFIRSIKCDTCGRQQLLLSEALPMGLSEDEAKIIGWTEVNAGSRGSLIDLGGKRAWLCPLHAEGGISKLRAVAREAGVK